MRWTVEKVDRFLLAEQYYQGSVGFVGLLRTSTCCEVSEFKSTVEACISKFSGKDCSATAAEKPVLEFSDGKGRMITPAIV